MDMKIYRLRREIGVCTTCGKEMAEEGHTTCAACRKKRRDERHKARIDAGICTKCGRRPAKDGGRYCQHCLDKSREYSMRRVNLYNHDEVPIPEEHAGECIRCTLPAVKDGLCEKHLRLREKKGA